METDEASFPEYEFRSIFLCKPYFIGEVLDIGGADGLWAIEMLNAGAKKVTIFDNNTFVSTLTYENMGIKYVQTRVCDKDGDGIMKIDGHGYKPRFIKIDVEGDEMLVLKGAEETIKKYKPKMMIESHDYLHPGRLDEIQALLRGWGREVTRIRYIPGGTSHMYHLYYF